jgi:hypothetical protein
VRGLPVGPAPSAFLADVVLSGLDRGLHEAGARHLRWVDDFLVAVDSLLEGRAVLDLLNREAELRGLTLNPRKTAIVTDREAVLRETSAGAPRPLA